MTYTRNACIIIDVRGTSPKNKSESKEGTKMQVLTIAIKNTFGQKERREARVVRSAKELPVGLGKVGEVNSYAIFADRAAAKLEYASAIFALKK